VLGVHWVTDTVGATLAVLGVGLVSASALRLLPVSGRDGRSLDA
jgi:membrane-associated phospholipid phosphatase